MIAAGTVQAIWGVAAEGRSLESLQRDDMSEDGSRLAEAS